jgi:hypothetical protein
VKFEAFVGASNPSGSPNVDIEHTVNLYLEMAGEGASAPKARNVFYARPGLLLLCTLPTTPLRGLWSNATRMFAVAGSKLYEIFSNGTYNDRGDVGNDGLPVQIFPNGNQILIVSNGTAYCDSGSGPVVQAFSGGLSAIVSVTALVGDSAVTWTSGDKFQPSIAGQTITIAGTGRTVIAYLSPTALLVTGSTGSPGTVVPDQAATWTGTLGAWAGAFLDGYFVVAQPGSRQFNHSAVNDGTSWDASDFFSKAGYPDDILQMLADHEELWLFGTDTTEVWQTTAGAASFQRIPGAFVHHGCAAKWSPTRLKEGVAWLVGEPNRGGVKAVYAQGFIPTRISTHAVETVWNGYSTVADAVSFSYEEDGHEFWIISFPTANATWVFDGTAGVWQEWGWWNGTSNDRLRQMFHAYWQSVGEHVVGDWESGKVYLQSTQYLTDAGTAIDYSRTAPHLSTEQLWNFYSKFQLDLEVGQSTSSPLIYLSRSDDGGHTWSTPISGTPADATYAGRLMWRRLGRSRDRVFRITGAAPSAGPRVAIVQALLDVTQGRG